MRSQRFRNRQRLLAIAASAVAVAVCSVAAAQTVAPASNNFLWKVQSRDRVLYLAGSVHALSADAYPLPAPFERAFDASGTLVEEIDLADTSMLAAAPLLMAKGLYQDGRTFEGVVSKETAALVAARLKNTPLSIEMLRPMKPWMVMLTLSAMQVRQAGFDTNLGLDKYFFDKAVAAGKTVLGLETAESQVDRFDRMPDALQEQMLRSTLAELDLESGDLKVIVAAWKKGDRTSLEKMLLAGFEQYPAAYTSLIVERNQNWLPQIERCFTRSQPCLVVVGAAHLVGRDGLLTMLEKKGYRVEQQ